MHEKLHKLVHSYINEAFEALPMIGSNEKYHGYVLSIQRHDPLATADSLDNIVDVELDIPVTGKRFYALAMAPEALQAQLRKNRRTREEFDGYGLVFMKCPLFVERTDEETIGGLVRQIMLHDSLDLYFEDISR